MVIETSIGDETKIAPFLEDLANLGGKNLSIGSYPVRINILNNFFFSSFFPGSNF